MACWTSEGLVSFGSLAGAYSYARITLLTTEEDTTEAANLYTWGPCSDVPINFQFSAQSRLKVNNLDLSDPIAIYQQFVTDEVLDVIVTETNRYALQSIQSHQLRPRSLMRNWRDTNREEIKHLLAVLMIMGINRLPKNASVLVK
jgi:hypothetical protein